MLIKTIRLARTSAISQTIGYYLAFIALGLVVASLGPTLPGLASLMHSRLRDISFLFTARAFGYLLGSFAGGRGYDRLAGHPLMGAVLLVMAAMMLLAPLMSSLALLTLVLLALGMAEGTLDVGGNTLLVWAHRAKVGPFMNGQHFFFGVGVFLSPIIIAQVVLLSGGITGAYWTLALLLLPCVAWIAQTPSPAAQTVQAHTAGQVNRFLVVLIGLFFFLYAGAESGFGGWVFTYAVALKLSDETVAAYLTSTFWGALTLGRLLAIPLAARFQPRSMLLADLLGCLLSLAIIILGSSSLPATWLGTFGLGLAMASIFPTTLVLAEQRMTITGRVTGWFFVGASIGSMTMPWLIGQLFEPVGPHSATLVLLIDLLIAVALFAILAFHSNRAALKTEA